jgi:WhiB family transcriptional regulator, redox-sensing transcriptional regulator
MQQSDLARLLTLLGGGEQWKSMAACGSAEPDLFFPISAATSNQLQVSEAKIVCARCLVRRECLDFAIQTRQMHGIWGGMTEEERYSAVKTRQQQAPMSVAAERVDAHSR